MKGMEKHLEKILLSRPNPPAIDPMTDRTLVAFNLSRAFFRALKNQAEWAYSPDGSAVYFDDQVIVQVDGCLCQKSQIDKKGIMGIPLAVIEIDGDSQKSICEAYGVGLYFTVELKKKQIQAYKWENAAYHMIGGGFGSLAINIEETDIFEGVLC